MNGVNGYDNFDGPTSAYVKRKRILCDWKKSELLAGIRGRFM